LWLLWMLPKRENSSTIGAEGFGAIRVVVWKKRTHMTPSCKRILVLLV
jgi:hypothetical protein